MSWTIAMLALGAVSQQPSRGPADASTSFCRQVRLFEPGDTLVIERSVGVGGQRRLMAQWQTQAGLRALWLFIGWRDRTGALTPPGDDALVVISYSYLQPRGFTRGRLEIHRPPRPDRRGALVLRGRRTDQAYQLDVGVRLGRFLAFARGAAMLELRVVGEDGRLLAEHRLDPAIFERAAAAVAAARPDWERLLRDRRGEGLSFCGG